VFRWLMAVILIPAGLTASRNGGPCHASTPFVLTSRGGVALAVMMNGRGPFRLLLDTGSTHSSIDTDVLGAIGARLVAQSPMSSVSGMRMTPIAFVADFSVGPYQASLLPSVVEALPDEREGVEGIVGQDVLAGLRYTIDFSRRMVVWYGPGCSHGREGRMTLALEPVGGRFLVRADWAGRKIRLVPDSATEHLVVYESADAAPAAHAGVLETLTSSVAATHRVVRDLRLEGTLLPPVAALAIPRPEGRKDVDGLLPMRLFDRATFDGPALTLILETNGRLMFF
jgi:hypothetical protein